MANSLYYKIFYIIQAEKQFYMGVAILLVLLLHLMFSGANPPAWYCKIFQFGYIGVDIFLFFSGIGLCRSFDKNSVGLFYLRRFKRIVPLYVLLAVIRSCVAYFVQGQSLSFWDVFCNVTSLSFYEIGGFPIAWYLAGLLLLYILFPVLYSLVRVTKGAIVLCSLPLCYLAVINIDLSWQQTALVSRLPIFLLGIHSYSLFKKPMLWLPWIVVFLLIGVVLQLQNNTYGSCAYLVSACFAPLLISLLALMLVVVKGRYTLIISAMGKFTLEAYVANTILMLDIMVNHNYGSSTINFILYVVLQILLTMVFVAINQFMQKQ